MIKRTRLSGRKPANKAAARLTELATKLHESSCRTEDKFWESALGGEVVARLRGSDEDALIAALDQLYTSGHNAYETLIDVVEAHCECLTHSATVASDIVLIAIPVLAWSRLPIPSGKLRAETLSAMRAQLHGHILASNAKLSLADHLLSPDQLPQSYCETRALTEALTNTALHDRNHALDGDKLPETAVFLSDTRYLLGAIAVPVGGALFRWQEAPSPRSDALQSWQRQAEEALRSHFPACAYELMAPTAFHAAIRAADRAARPYSLNASVDFLRTVLTLEPHALQVTIGSYFSNRQMEEYRIGFSPIDGDEVFHGIVWPILDDADENPEALSAIEQQLRAAGIGRIQVLQEQLPMEFCDDCGAPLFPNREGEPTHAELPTGADNSMPQHLH